MAVGVSGGQVASVANPAVAAVRPSSNGRVSSGSAPRRTPIGKPMITTVPTMETELLLVSGGPARVTSAAAQVNQREVVELRAQVEELHNHSATIEKESQFYFGKVSYNCLVLDNDVS